MQPPQSVKRGSSRGHNASGPSAAPAETGRLRALSLAAGCLLLLAAMVWREPAELWLLRRRPLPELQRYAERHPDSIRAALALGEAALAAGQPRQAAESLAPAASRFPAHAELRTLYGRALLDSGQVGAAHAELQVVVSALNPTQAEPYWLLGQTLERAERPEEARAQYETALKRDPRHTRALLRLGYLTGTDGQLTEAEAFIRRAAAVEPDSAEIAAALAEVLFRLGRPAESAEAARSSLRANPKGVKASFWLARSLHALDPLGNAAEAEAAYRKAISAGGETADARVYLAQLLRRRNRSREALQEMETNLTANPLHKSSHYELSLCARILGQPERAAAAMRRFKELDRIDREGSQLEYQVWSEPHDVKRRLALAQFYVRHRRPDLARPQVERILREHPEDPEARRLSAQIAAHPEPTL
ncbi:MAG: tetratricopeptide repeat protein [Actinomycetota bacterium]